VLGTWTTAGEACQGQVLFQERGRGRTAVLPFAAAPMWSGVFAGMCGCVLGVVLLVPLAWSLLPCCPAHLFGVTQHTAQTTDQGTGWLGLLWHLMIRMGALWVGRVACVQLCSSQSALIRGYYLLLLLLLHTVAATQPPAHTPHREVRPACLRCCSSQVLIPIRDCLLAGPGTETNLFKRTRCPGGKTQIGAAAGMCVWGLEGRRRALVTWQWVA
jgi:hypothetical protein